MRYKLVFAGLMLLAGFTRMSAQTQKFDKAGFYEIMKSGTLETVGNEIELVKSAAPEKERDGYEGALLMKKAGLLKKPKQRLDFFKPGRIKLESAISADNENTEFHFLRLAIQEHAPKIVKYHSDIENDKTVIVRNFKSLSPAVRHAILDYCDNSKVLHREDF
jgi:hypothetical protein